MKTHWQETMGLWWKRLASLNWFFWIAGALIVAMTAGTLLPKWNLYRQPWFIGLLVLLGANTAACVIHRWKAIRYPSLISHLGLLVILGGSAFTLWKGERGTLTLAEGEGGLCCAEGPNNTTAAHLPFQVRLKKFTIEQYRETAHTLRLSHREKGWVKEWTNVSVGQRLTHRADNHEYAITVKRYVADFIIDLETRTIKERSKEPRNPALLVSVEASPKRDLWVFAKFPDIHQEQSPVSVEYACDPGPIKQYKSWLEVVTDKGDVLHGDTIWVNKPMRFRGYTFYQSGYDPDRPGISTVEVAKDPGVPYVYGGFLLLTVGLGLNVLRRKP